MTFSDRPSFYPYLTHMVGRNLQQYSNAVMGMLASSAPNLTEICLHFADVRLENEEEGDAVLHLEHPALQWATLLNGDYHFKGIRVGDSCKNLKLLKFRDFELESFHNPKGVRYWSEKNLLNDKDFF